MAEQQQKQTIFDLPKVMSVGVASPLATLLTSRFGVAGTVIGLALTAVIGTTVSDFLKVSLQRMPGAVTSIPGGFRKRPRWQNILIKLSLPFTKFWSLTAARRRSILIGSVVAAVISFLIGISIVTAVELGVGKSLSCWVWNNCPTESSTADGSTSRTSTLGTIFGGVQNQAPPAEQPPASKPELPPSQQEAAPGSEQPITPLPGQGESTSGVPEDHQGTPPPVEEQQGSEDDQSKNDQNEDEQDKAPPAEQDDSNR
jgi:hypothetical protein